MKHHDLGTPELHARHKVFINERRAFNMTQRPADAWLSMGYIESYHHQACERLYQSFIAAGMGDSPTMDWDRYMGASRDTSGEECGDAQWKARKQYREALLAVKDPDVRATVESLVCHAGNDAGAMFTMTTTRVRAGFMEALGQLARYYGYAR
jgi:hypothetical protein